MESDRELLEMAAKAAKIEHLGWVPAGLSFAHRGPWNPLEDDGDEARLEAALSLHVTWYRQFVSVNSCTRRYYSHGGDKQAARRRAGVMAAAEIGKTLG